MRHINMRQDVKNIMSQNLEKMTVNCNLFMEKLDETHKYEIGRKKHHVTESGKDDSKL